MRFFLTILAVVVALSAAVSCSAQSDADEVFIYKGTSLSQSGITVGSWGSGKAMESKEKMIRGSQSIKVTTQSRFAGGRIEFNTPVPLFTDGINKDRYILFTMFFTDVQKVDPAAGTGYWFDVEPYLTPKASVVRFVFISEDGKMLATEQPSGELDPDDNWVRVAVPLAKFDELGDIKKFDLKKLLVFTDIPSVLYIGEIKLVNDTTPIKVDDIGSQTVAIYDVVFWEGNARGGLSSLKYSWDFNKADGIQEESTKRVGQYVYTRGGEYVVTLTVSDVNGVKEPVQVTGEVSVID